MPIGLLGRRAIRGRPGDDRRVPGLRRLGLLAGDRALQLVLVHRGPALDPEALGLGVELITRAALRAVGPRALAAAARGGHVPRRRARALPRLAGPGALLIDRPRGDLLGARLGTSLILDAVLDVL